MLWFAGPRKVMVFSREENDLGHHAEMFERAEPLLALLEGNAIVVVGMQDQGGRFDVLRVLERR